MTPADIQKFIRRVPQIVPENRCFECRICCRFPDTQEVQIPYWSSLEADWAREQDRTGSWLKPVPGSASLEPRLVSCGDAGYRCPAFDARTRRCTIHSVKPLDCRLYPFVVARHPSSSACVLAVDTKCPYIQEHLQDPDLTAYAARLSEYLETPEAGSYLEMNPKLAGPFWPEYASVASLPWRAGKENAGEGRPPHPALKPWGNGPDLREFRTALRRRPHAFSGYTAASLLGWKDLIPLWCASVNDALCLFSGSADCLYMPLPPLTSGRRIDPDLLRSVWTILEEANHGGSTSRIEGIEAPQAEDFLRAGFCVKPGEREYLYRREDLMGLRGNRHRAHRWAINRLERGMTPGAICVRPFRDSDTAECLRLYTRWAVRKQARTEDRHERALIRDGLFFHRRLMMDHETLGLTGRIVQIRGDVAGYTVGGPVSDRVFCVFLEIADPVRTGVSQLLFRELCRAAAPALLVNAMGDAGLARLRSAKRSYHPIGFSPVFTAMREGEWS